MTSTFTCGMESAAAASNDTTAALPASSPEGDSVSTSVRMEGMISSCRSTKYLRRISMVELESSIYLARRDSLFSHRESLNPCHLNIEPDAGPWRRCDR